MFLLLLLLHIVLGSGGGAALHSIIFILYNVVLRHEGGCWWLCVLIGEQNSALQYHVGQYVYVYTKGIILHPLLFNWCAVELQALLLPYYCPHLKFSGPSPLLLSYLDQCKRIANACVVHDSSPVQETTDS